LCQITFKFGNSREEYGVNSCMYNSESFIPMGTLTEKTLNIQMQYKASKT